MLCSVLLVLTACETGLSDCSKAYDALVPCIGDSDAQTCTSTCCQQDGAMCQLCNGFCRDAGTAIEYFTASCVDACNSLSPSAQAEVFVCAGASTCTALLVCQRRRRV